MMTTTMMISEARSAVRGARSETARPSRSSSNASKRAVVRNVPAHWGIVDASLIAGAPEMGSKAFIHSVCLASGGSGVPLGAKSLVSGSTSGRSVSGMPIGSPSSSPSL